MVELDIGEDWPADDIDEEEDEDPLLPPSPAVEPASGNAALQTAVDEHSEAVERQAWSQCADCAGRVVELADGRTGGLALTALAEMALHMVKAAGGRGEQLLEEEGEWRDRCSALRDACLTIVRRQQYQWGEDGDEEEATDVMAKLVVRGEGASVVLAWILQQQEESMPEGEEPVAAEKPEHECDFAEVEGTSTMQANIEGLAGPLLISCPSIPALCCAEHVCNIQGRRRRRRRRQGPEQGGGGAQASAGGVLMLGEGGSWSSSSSEQQRHAVLDCMLGALAAMSVHGVEVQAALKGWAAPPGPGGGIGGFVLQEPQWCKGLQGGGGDEGTRGRLAALDCPPVLEQARVVGAVSSGVCGGGLSRAAVRARAERLWQVALKDEEEAAAARLSGGGKGKKAREEVVVAVLRRMRKLLILAVDKEGGERKKVVAAVDAGSLGRALLVLVAREEVAITGEVLGHVLPLCFTMMEEYEKDDLQLLGLLGWLSSVDRTTPTELSWHLPINVNVMQRCLKVVRRPQVLRVLLVALAELLRLARPADRQDLEVQRGMVLEDVMASLARTTDHTKRYVLIEGLLRVVQLYSGGYLLVRYLRPLVQVLTQQLEDGDYFVRAASLVALSVVVGYCEPMAHQHAIHVLAAITRLYLFLDITSTTKRANDEEESRRVALLRSHCITTCVSLERACASKPAPHVDMVAFLTSLAEEPGCAAVADLKQALVQQQQQQRSQQQQQQREQPINKAAVKPSKRTAAPAGGGGGGGGGGGKPLIREL